MKALIAAAALAALPFTAGAVTVTTSPTYDYGLTTGSVTYTFATALDDVEYFFAVPFGTATFDLAGTTYSVGAGAESYFLGDFAVGDSFTVAFSGAITSYAAAITGVSPVPVPAAGLLAGAGVVALGAVKARRKKA